MLSYAARYFPIWQKLQQLEVNFVLPHSKVLEVGSGAEGLALFWKGPLTSVDVRFKRRPMAQGVAGSALELPFAANSFNTVVSCDMLEHLPAAQRRAAVVEMLRVCGDCLLLGFPSGAVAWKMYQDLAGKWGNEQPAWLREHLALGLPEADVVAGWITESGWQVSHQWYESAAVHSRRVWRERVGLARWASYLAARAWGSWLIRRETSVQPADPLRILLCASSI